MFFHLAADDVDVAPTTDIEDINEATDELSRARTTLSFSGPYWPRIRATLLKNSSSTDVEEAVKEWTLVRMWMNSSSCELCEHTPIKYHFQIANRINGNKLVVGSECIWQYLLIPGMPDPDTLKKRLNSLRNRAKAMAAGQVSPDDLTKLQTLHEMERELNITIGKVCAPERDIDVKEYSNLLQEPYQFGQILGIKSATFQEVRDAINALYRLCRFLEGVGKRSTKYKPFMVLPAVSTIMGFRSGTDDRLQQLQTFKECIAKSFNAGPANGLIKMAWEEVRNHRDQAIDKLNDALDKAKASCQDAYAETLNYVRPFDHLHFIIQAGIDSNKAQMDRQAADARENIEDPDFFDKLAKQRGARSFQGILPSFTTYLTTGDSRMEDAAYKTLQFIATVRGTIPYELTTAISDIWHTRVEDFPSLRKAILQAANDGVINPESGADALTELTVLLRKNDPKAMEVLQENSEDVKAAVKAARQQKVYEAMSEAWGFDVRRFYEAVPWDHPYFPNFCSQMLKSFMNGRREPTAKEWTSINKNMAKYRAPVKNSCWDHLQRSLMAPYRPSYNYER